MDENLPLISCLMVTRGTHIEAIDASIFSFISQSYENKEMIIVSDFNVDKLKLLLDKYKNEKIKLIQLSERYCVGDLRNISIENASGDYCIIWDDDDLSHRDRIKMQYEKIIVENSDFCVLKEFLMYFYETKQLTKNRWYDDIICGLPPTILFKNIPEFRYSSIQYSEDLHFFLLGHLNRCVLDNMSHLYVYTYKNSNSYDESHYVNLCNSTKKTFDSKIIDNVSYLFNYLNLEFIY